MNARTGAVAAVFVMAAAVVTMVEVWESVPALFVAVIVNVAEPAEVEVPDTTPVEESKTSPSGRAPEISKQITPATGPVFGTGRRANPVTPKMTAMMRPTCRVCSALRIAPEADGYVAIDLIGRRVTEIVEWVAAEEALKMAGIAYFADPYGLLFDNDRWLRVRIVEVSTDTIRVKQEDWGAIDAPHLEYALPFPASTRLRLNRGQSDPPDFRCRVRPVVNSGEVIYLESLVPEPKLPLMRVLSLEHFTRTG